MRCARMLPAPSTQPGERERRRPGGRHHAPASSAFQSPDFPPRFSRTLTSVIVIPRSTALHILVSVRSVLPTVLQIKDLLFARRSILSKSVSELGQRLDKTWTTIPDHSPNVSLRDQQHPWICAEAR